MVVAFTIKSGSVIFIDHTKIYICYNCEKCQMEISTISSNPKTWVVPTSESNRILDAIKEYDEQVLSQMKAVTSAYSPPETEN